MISSIRAIEGEAKRTLISPPLVSGNSWCWLAAAVIALLFADGRNTIALAAGSRPRAYFASHALSPSGQVCGLLTLSLP
jgi:hypothetical protein